MARPQPKAPVLRLVRPPVSNETADPTFVRGTLNQFDDVLAKLPQGGR